MKKLISLMLVVAAVGFVAISSARAEEGSELEISGNVDVVSGWQRGLKNANFASEGLLGDGLAASAAGKSTDVFGFVVDQVEVDLAKSFGENIRARADIDFSTFRYNEDSGAMNGAYVEQGYVTANIPAGNGMELLVGRFNSGIGLDPADRNELNTVSFSMLHRTLLPHNMTGARFGYQASDAVWFDFYVVNNLQDAIPANSDIPSGGFDVKYSWGEEGSMSWFKLSGAIGPEQATNKHYSFLGDLAAKVLVSDGFWLGAEGAYRQDNKVAGTVNARYMGGQLKGTYAFSDIWDGTLRYGFTWDMDGGTGTVGTGRANANPLGTFFSGVAGTPFTGLGAKGQLHDLSLATGYQITDGAKFIVEARLDMSRPNGAATGYQAGVGGQFAYSF